VEKVALSGEFSDFMRQLTSPKSVPNEPAVRFASAFGPSSASLVIKFIIPEIAFVPYKADEGQ